MRIDGGLTAHEKAVLVLQHHVTVGVDGPENLGGIRVVNLVPHHGGGGGLHEGRSFPGGDVEALPVDVGVASGGDGELRSGGFEGG